ncbi:MAG TPA: hypothetical protein VKX25_17635 [Bryobacteraceae bacterium]|jgi:hypothetical protein|nr:hypothetical protein [Bryobacteraceae bacterium]
MPTLGIFEVRLIAVLHVDELLRIERGLQQDSERMIHAAGDVAGADPAVKLEARQGVAMAFIGPEFDFDVLDLVARDQFR